MMKTITYLLLGFALISCNFEKDNYLRNTEISNKLGLPSDSLTFYYPSTIVQNSKTTNTGIDTFMLNWFSSALYAAKEPILYNYYLGHDIYRFLWLRSFQRPVIISLHKNKGKVVLITKVLDKQPDFIDELSPQIKFVAPDSLHQNDSKKEIIKKADRKAAIVFNQKTNLSKKDWREFERLLNNCSFWETLPFIEDIGIDGSEWIIEAHRENKYWFINRWTPEDDFRKAGEFLISKSGLNEEVY